MSKQNGDFMGVSCFRIPHSLERHHRLDRDDIFSINGTFCEGRMSNEIWRFEHRFQMVDRITLVRCYRAKGLMGWYVVKDNLPI